MDPIEREITALPATLQRKMARLALGGWTFEQGRTSTNILIWWAFPPGTSLPLTAAQRVDVKALIDAGRVGKSLAEMLHNITEEDF